MFARKCIQRIFVISQKLVETDPKRLLRGCDRLTYGITRYSSKKSDDRSKISLSLSELNKKNEASLINNDSEVFDLEEERKELDNVAPLPKYQIFKDEDAPLILDVEEEKLAQALSSPQKLHDKYDGISLERGFTGVFDVEELVEVLRRQSAQNIVAIELSHDVGYADYMVIVTGRSKRHMFAVAEFVRTLFKKKRHENDRIPVIEGRRTDSDGWLALDLGNIILHIFSEKTREEYDLESLWILGPEYDPHLNKQNEEISLENIMSKHSVYLSDLQPDDANR